MAGKKENIKALFSNSRSRIIILFTVILLVITVVVGIMKFSNSSSTSNPETSLAGGVGGIESIPGSMNQTAQYAALQATQNIEQADKARQSGQSAIPTIIRTHAFGDGVEVIGQKEGEGGADFSALTNDNSGESGPTHAWIDMLKTSHCSKASLDKVISQGGTISDLKTACSCGQLKIAGYKVKELEPVCSCAELKAANFDIVQLKEGGFTAGRIRLCGYTACDTRGVGFSAQEMKDAGFSDGELKGAGFSEQDIARASGLPDGMTISDVQKAGCDASALTRLHTSGVTAAAIRRINGCSTNALKTAGFTAREMKNAGFSAAEMKNAGFNAADLQAASFGARDLLNAGFTNEDLINAGFSAVDIKAAEAVLPFGLTAADVKKAGCSVEAIKRQRLAGVSATLIHNHAGCSVNALNQAGFSKTELENAGFTAAQITASVPVIDNNTIRAAGCNAEKLKVLMAQGANAGRIHSLNGCSLQTLKQAGFDAKSLLDAGFSPKDLQTEGFTPAELSAAESAEAVSSDAIHAAGCDPDKLKVLMVQGATAGRIHGINGCSADVLKQAGFDLKSLINAGFKSEDLIQAGFTAAELSATEPTEALTNAANHAVSNDEIQRAGCDPEKLKVFMTQGISAGRIHGLNGCSAEVLKQAGFDAKSLLEAGFSPVDLQQAGFTAAELAAAESSEPVSSDSIRAAGCDPDKLKVLIAQGATAGRIHGLNGCSADVLKQAGFDLKSLINAGFKPADLIQAGFTAAELSAVEPKDAGANTTVGNDEIQRAGCDPEKLKVFMAEGVSAGRIHGLNGCSVDVLKNAGFDAKSLLDAGFSSADLQQAGYTAAELAAAESSEPVSSDSIRAAGCDPDKLKLLIAQGATAGRIHGLNGCSAEILKKAGFDAKSLINAGFTPRELLKVGFTAAALTFGLPSEAAGNEVVQSAGCDPDKLKALMAQGIPADRIHQLNGCSAEILKQAGFDAKAVADAGFTPEELLAAGFTAEQLIQAGLSPTAVIAAGRTDGCSAKSLAAAHQLGVSAGTIKQTLGCNANALNNAGFSPTDLKKAGYTAAELKNAGFTLNDLKGVGYGAKSLAAAGWSAKQLKDAGFSARQLKDAGFSAQELKAADFNAQELKTAGFSAQQLKEAGFSAQQLKAAGFSTQQLKEGGFSAANLKNAGLSVQELKNAGFSATELKQAGVSAAQLKGVGFTGAALKEAGFNADALRAAGFSTNDMQTAGFNSDQIKRTGFPLGASNNGSSVLAGLDSITAAPPTTSTVPVFATPATGAAAIAASNTKRIEELRSQQEKQAAVQRYQQKIQERGGAMLAAANQLVQDFKAVPQQLYAGGAEKDEKQQGIQAGNELGTRLNKETEVAPESKSTGAVVIRTGDILFAVIDTSVNTDEPGPILATIVSGKLAGSKLIGSFNLPGQADKMIVTFNTLSIPGADSTVSITAFAIDPNTARTALSSETDHHYLSRYGALFASTFIQGFGNAFQSSGTTITIGGTGGTTNTTVQNGVGRSTLDNAVIGLATLGQAWSQDAQKNVSRPTTVQLYAGTGVGVLFTQDLKLN